MTRLTKTRATRDAALASIIQAIEDLVDGLGGDAQERDRCAEICDAIRALVSGQPVSPLTPHNDARAAYEEQDEEGPP